MGRQKGQKGDGVPAEEGQGQEGQQPTARAGDETGIPTATVTGFPPAVQPPISPLTYQDPFPPKKNIKGPVIASEKKAKDAKEVELFVPKLRLDIGNASNFKKTLNTLLEKETAARPGVPIRQILAEMLVDGALAGDKWALEQIMDRTDGKPMQMVEVNPGIRNPLADLSDAQLAAFKKMREKLAEKRGWTDIGKSKENT